MYLYCLSPPVSAPLLAKPSQASTTDMCQYKLRDSSFAVSTWFVTGTVLQPLKRLINGTHKITEWVTLSLELILCEELFILGVECYCKDERSYG